MTKASVLLTEASADDWKEMKPRIEALKATIKMLPKGPPKRKKVGY